ncbi:X-ray radiation resistance-associated protein 1 [Cololabis saira]|uniref:X-ray radiation resistance-associated protein 1 n=1 Tax=Cololabis saira TaxID=129043 RepID=UPI002AD3E1DF|nr:X-ray radiation resistance-associated protein 1 [Cololabis saira]
MASGGYNYTTNCLPVKRSQRPRREGAGHWPVASRKAKQQKHGAVLRRVKDASSKYEHKDAGVLDGLLLLQIHCVEKPFQLCSINISERKLKAVKPEELKVFENVAYIDASINSLSLGSFSCFPALRELNLSLNGICNITLDVASFPHLEVLDLSYNRLSPEDIVSVGRLPHLKALHLTGNNLRRLPPDLGSSNPDSTQLPTEGKLFEVLEVLMLDDNKLFCGVFYSLASLPRLKYLNLQRNNISEIPCMQATSSLKDVHISVEEEVHTEVNLTTEEHLKVLKSFHTGAWEENCSRSSLPLPLPELQFLNLAENQIDKEEALIAADIFPKLREIDIHSNPLATKRRGDSPLLTYLQKRLKIKWKKTKGAVSPDSKWKRMTAEENQGSRTSHEQSMCCQIMTDSKASPDVLKHVGKSTAVRMLEYRLKNLNVYRESKPKLDSIQTSYRERKKKTQILPLLRPVKQSHERVDEMYEAIKKQYNID